jgi:acyl-CoA synthetase (AMP-forming)/AMP-acid ligase II
MIFYYGTTETSTISSAPAHALTGTTGAVGHVAPDVSVRIVDETGAPLPSGYEGIVLVRTPVSVTGYLETMGQSETAFRDGHFDTGDIGFLTRDRMLVITGRKKEVLNLGGDKVSPQIIEDAIAAFMGIREAGAFSMPNEVGVEEVWSFIVHGEAIDKEALHKHCRERLTRTHVPVRFISVPALPRNANGKLQRQRLAPMAQELGASGR